MQRAPVCVSFTAATLRQGIGAGAFNAASDHSTAVNGMGLPAVGAYAGMQPIRTGVTTDEKARRVGFDRLCMRGAAFGLLTRGAFRRCQKCRRYQATRTGLGGAAVAVDIDKFNQRAVDDWGSH